MYNTSVLRELHTLAAKKRMHSIKQSYSKINTLYSERIKLLVTEMQFVLGGNVDNSDLYAMII